ncbi:MAG: hypothetical protein Q9218_008380, partial [Villophora microphyllina]
MTAVTAPQPPLPHQLSNNQENLRQYVSAQIRQLSPERPSRSSMARTSVRQESSQSSSKPIRRVNTEAPITSGEAENVVPFVDDRTKDWVRQTAKPAALVRSNTDAGPGMSRLLVSEKPENAREDWELRHGYDELYNSTGFLAQLSANYFMYYTEKRHETGGKPRQVDPHQNPAEWRMRDRLKTVSAALVMCLNLGVDPPDV